MAAAIFLSALFTAIAGFFLSYFAAGYGALASLGIGYLAGSLAAIVYVFVCLAVQRPRTKKDKPTGYPAERINSRHRN